MGWSAVQGGLGVTAFLLYVAGIFWTLGYDTVYAHQDKRDDVLVGVKSLALKLGGSSRVWIGGFYAASLLVLALAGLAGDMGRGFYVLLACAAVHAVWQVAFWRMDDPADCARRFASNRDFGLIVLVALMLGKMS